MPYNKGIATCDLPRRPSLLPFTVAMGLGHDQGKWMTSAAAAIAHTFACPACAAPALVERGADGDVVCEACAQAWPRLSRIPILMPGADAVMTQWQNRYAYLLATLAEDAEQLKQSLQRSELLPVTNGRLRHLLQAKVEQAKCLQKILAPLVQAPWASVAMHQLAQTQSPPAQQLMGYYANACRDWDWGEEENQRTLVLLRRLFGDRSPVAKAAIWGAGAGRLAFDWHQTGLSETSFAIDLNPFLLLVAERVIRGQDTTLYEFPIAPVHAKDCAVKRRLAAPAKARPGLWWLMADALTLPCQAPGLDMIITPWLIDVIAVPFPVLAASVNRCLAPGGLWLNLGSLAYREADAALCMTQEEVFATLGQQGFALATQEEEWLPYLQCPESRQRRWENLFAFAAVKEAATASPHDRVMGQAALDLTQPLPLTHDLQQKLAINRLFVAITEQIDGQKTGADLSQHVAQLFGLGLPQAEALVRQFLSSLYEQKAAGHQF